MRNASESAPAPTARRVGTKAAAKRAPAKKIAAKKATPRPRVSRVAAAEGGDLAARAAQNTLTANPLIGIRAADLQLAARALLKGAAKQPTLFMRHFAEYAGALGDVVRGKSTVAPDPKDRRFADPAWQTNFLHRRLMQIYLQSAQGIDKFISATDLSALDKERAQFLASLIVDGMAPSNTLLGNPTALKKIVDTGGASLRQGPAEPRARHAPQRHAAVAGRQHAVQGRREHRRDSPGAVVFRNEVLELIQYTPTHAEGLPAPAAHRAAADQQVLRRRPVAREEPRASGPSTAACRCSW